MKVTRWNKPIASILAATVLGAQVLGGCLQVQFWERKRLKPQVLLQTPRPQLNCGL